MAGLLVVIIMLGPLIAFIVIRSGSIGRRRLQNRKNAYRGGEKITNIESKKYGSRMSTHFEGIVYFEDGTSYRDIVSDEEYHHFYKKLWVDKNQIPRLVRDALIAHENAVIKNESGQVNVNHNAEVLEKATPQNAGESIKTKEAEAKARDYTNIPRNIHEIIIFLLDYHGSESALTEYLERAVRSGVLNKEREMIFLAEWKNAEKECRLINAEYLDKSNTMSEYWAISGLCPKCGGEMKKSAVFNPKCSSCGYIDF